MEIFVMMVCMILEGVKGLIRDHPTANKPNLPVRGENDG
jgi:hypothetical protein